MVPNEDWVKNWASENNLEGDFASLCKSAELKELIVADMQRLATEKMLSSLEKPKEVHLSSELFSIENDTLTPTMKLKRN